MQRLDALIAAGAPLEGPGPLAAAEGARRKAEIDLHGHSMLWWTLQALRGSGRLGRLIVLGGEPEDVIGIEGPAECLPVEGGLLDKIVAGLQHVADSSPRSSLTLFASADMPLLTPALVDWFIDACMTAHADLYYPVVEQRVMEERFPSSGRTYVALREGRFCGGDIVMARVDAALAQQELLRDLVRQRKSPLRQARLIGVGPLIKLLSRRLSIAEAERIAGRALGVRGKVIISPYAELAMDVDKPHHLAIVREELAGRLSEVR
jgi:GTP:adenosylcobinamide-phosphate guanylyltransferase